MSTATPTTSHSTASRIVANWHPTSKGCWTGIKLEDETETHGLEFKSNSYVVSVRFTKIRDRDDVMRVRSTNWRCEDEPNGVFDIEECRQFYRVLVAAGFTAF